MSNVFYPVALIDNQQVTRFDRTVFDEFESGAINTRRIWAAQTFKRKFDVTHGPLVFSEWKYLKSFFQQRGMFDPFWYRDNLNRDGNAYVRFADALTFDRGPAVWNERVKLEEMAPIRNLPEFDEMTTAAGVAPLFWWDANREIYLSNAGVVLSGEAGAYDVMGNYPAPWQGGSALNLGNLLTQYQHYNFTGTQWAKTAGNVAELTGAQPAVTLFAIVRHSAFVSSQVLFAIGALGTGNAVGIALQGSGNGSYFPWIGGATLWGTTKQDNTPVDTWRSIAITWAASSNTASVYCNGALIAASANTRTYTTGPAVLGAAFDGSSIENPGNALTNANMAHALAFSSALTLAQIKAVHNLLGYQYGLAIV